MAHKLLTKRGGASMMSGERKGATLIIALLISAVLLTLIVAFGSRLISSYKMGSHSSQSSIALDLAEAAVERGIWELNYGGGSWSGWTTDVDAGGITTHTLTVTGFSSSYGTSVGDFVSEVVRPPIYTNATVTGAGYVPSQANPVAERTVLVTFINSIFANAVFGETSVTMTGQAVTDSYDSALGSYGSQTHGSEGDIGTNGDITLVGSVYVNGDAVPGPGHTVSNPELVSGEHDPASSTYELDDIPSSLMSSVQASNNNANIQFIHFNGPNPPEIFSPGANDLKLTSDTHVDLPAGNYYFTSISISGTAELSVSGAAKIYVSGSIAAAGQGITNAGVPASLQIYSTGESVSLSGDSPFSGTVYAPDATVTVSGQATVYGSLTGNIVNCTGQGGVHYDEALRRLQPPSFSLYKTETWQEK